MATQTKKQNGQQTQTVEAKPETLLDQSIAATESRLVSYKPFMASEEIKLSANMVLKYFAVRTKEGMLPTVVQAEKFVMLCKTRGLNPWEGDAYLVGYDTKDGPQFNLITAHQAFLKRAEASPQYDGMESGVIVRHKPSGEVRELQGDFFGEDEILLGGWAKVFRKDQKHPTLRRLKLATFRKPFGVWTSNPEGMIVKCAEGDALRSAFPLSLAGMYMGHEHTDTEREPEDKPSPPVGRVAAPRPERTPAATPETPPEPTPEEEQQITEAEMFVQDLFDDICTQIGEADTTAELDDIADAVKLHGPALGERLAQDLEYRITQRGKSIK